MAVQLGFPATASATSLNPPYNSLAEEVTLAPEGDNRWLQGTTLAAELGIRSLPGGSRADGPNATRVPAANRRSPEPTVADGGPKPDPSQFRFAEEPPAQPDQHVDRKSKRAITPSGRIRRPSAETGCRSVLSNEAVRPAARAAGNGLDRPDDS